MFSLILRRLRVVGGNTGSVADLRRVVRAIEAGGIRPVLDKVFSFDEAPEAYAVMARGGHFWKFAVTV